MDPEGRMKAVLMLLTLLPLGTLPGCNGSRDGDPAAIVREALREPDQLERAARLTPLLAGLQPDELEPVVAAYELGFGMGAERGLALVLLTEAWVDVDPEGAFARISSWPMEIRVEALGDLMRAWARRDPRAAWRAYESLEPKRLYVQVQKGLLLGWAESGDRGFWNLVAAFEPGLPRENAARLVMEAVLARDGAEALLQEVEGFPEDMTGRFKLAALRTAAEMVAGVDPPRAVAFAEKHAGTQAGGGMYPRIAQKWAQYDGMAAIEWAVDLEPGSQRDRVLRQAFNRWKGRDPEAALAWMEARPGDASVAPLFGPFLRELAEGEPQRALDWAARIPAPEARERMLREVGAIWVVSEPDAARGPLTELGIYEAVLEAAAKRPKGRQGQRMMSDARLRQILGGAAGAGAVVP